MSFLINRNCWRTLRLMPFLKRKSNEAFLFLLECIKIVNCCVYTSCMLTIELWYRRKIRCYSIHQNLIFKSLYAKHNTLLIFLMEKYKIFNVNWMFKCISDLRISTGSCNYVIKILFNWIISFDGSFSQLILIND